MRSSKRKAFILATATSFAGIYGLTAGQASGANATWNSVAANSFWNNSSNWSSAGAAYLPVNGDNLFFNGSNLIGLNNDFASLTSGSIVFNAGAAALTLGGNGLTLGACA